MNLEQNGRNCLAAMKKTLAAGLPLAGLLAATGCGSSAPEGPASTAGSTPCPPPPAPAVSPALNGGEIPITEEYVTAGLLLAPEEAPPVEPLSEPDLEIISYRTKGVPVRPPSPPPPPAEP